MTDAEKAAVFGLILMAANKKSAKAPAKGGPMTDLIREALTPRPPQVDPFRASGTQWPMPTLLVQNAKEETVRTFPAVVSDGFLASRKDHVGVDMMYKRQMRFSSAADGKVLEWLKKHDSVINYAARKSIKTWDARYYPPPQGSELFFAPLGLGVRPFAAGRLWYANKSARGYQVLVDHGDFVTYYQHLSRLSVPLAEAGKADGKIVELGLSSYLGGLGADPTGGKKSPVHLHFEVWRYDTAKKPPVRVHLDPEGQLRTAARWSIEVPEDPT